MKTKIVLSPFLFSLLTACNTTPVTQSSQALGGVSQILQQGQQAVGVAQAVQSGSLTDLLMQQVGVSQTQAQGGAGALFQMAKSQMQANAFSQLSRAVPGMDALLKAAPAMQQNPALGALSGLGGNSGNMLNLASAFQQQGMSPSMIQQFIPVVLQYVKGSAGDNMAGSLGSALLGGQ